MRRSEMQQGEWRNMITSQERASLVGELNELHIFVGYAESSLATEATPQLYRFLKKTHFFQLFSQVFQ